MTNTELSHITRCRLAANVILKNIHGYEVSFVGNNFFDLIARERESDFTFGIKIGGYTYIQSKDFQERYIPNLENFYKNAVSNKAIPICIICVNEQTEEYRFGIIVSVRWGAVKVFSNPFLTKLTNLNVPKIIELMKESDYLIRALNNDSMGVLKTVSFSLYKNNSHTFNAFVAYRRNFSYQYKILTPEIISEKEKFERSIHGIPQDEYPSDLFDNIVKEALEKKFEDVSIHNSLYLFTTDRAELRIKYEQYKRRNLTIIISTPQIEEVLSSLSNVITLPKITLSLLVLRSTPDNLFLDELIPLEKNINEWKQIYMWLNKFGNTFTDIRNLLG